MNAIKLRFTFALAIACVLSMAAGAHQSSATGLAAGKSCPDSHELNLVSEGGGSSGGGGELVKWESLVPGVFK